MCTATKSKSAASTPPSCRCCKEQEKAELLRRCRQGDKPAREKLISGNLRLVLSVVQKFSNRGENLDDLFQVGCIGLMKAIDNFNPRHGWCGFPPTACR